jgi:hypothetical protein
MSSSFGVMFVSLYPTKEHNILALFDADPLGGTYNPASAFPPQGVKHNSGS